MRQRTVKTIAQDESLFDQAHLASLVAMSAPFLRLFWRSMINLCQPWSLFVLALVHPQSGILQHFCRQHIQQTEEYGMFQIKRLSTRLQPCQCACVALPSNIHSLLLQSCISHLIAVARSKLTASLLRPSTLLNPESLPQQGH